MYGIGEYDIDDDLDCVGEVVYLCCEYWFDEGFGIGDGCEVVVVEYLLVGGDVVFVILFDFGWSGLVVIGLGDVFFDYF